EARVYAEDSVRGFLPATGTVVLVEEPCGRPGVRVDSALARGATVGIRYDPMLAKVVARGVTRTEALDRLRAALEQTAVLGVTTNVGYLTRLLAHPDVVAGRLDTGLVDRTLGELAGPDETDTRDAAVAAACRLVAGLEPAGSAVDPWEVPDGWSIAGPRQSSVALRLGGRTVSVTLRGRVREGATVHVDGGPALQVRAEPMDVASSVLSLTIDGTSASWQTAFDREDIWVSRGGDSWRFAPGPGGRAERGTTAKSAGPVTSPMPGVVVAVHAVVGDVVRSGQTLVTVEAMKMEHAVVATEGGVVMEVLVRPGQSVGLDQLLARVEPVEPVGPGDPDGAGHAGGAD
ncbi:MAG TPA: biotin/lipoyl-containing protein, partial [Acidimicrobiales bacterium]|nr:biotin/lipoyl-containing protein [Acidimicrobiales bacterium]